MEEEKLLKKQQEQESEPEQPIDDQQIGDIVGGRDPFTTVPRVPNQPIDDFVTENG